MTGAETKPTAKSDQLRILLVDDQREILNVLTEVFQQESWKVFVATDGAHALRIMSTEKFDAIVTDLNMPRMGGLEFLGHAKVNHLNKKAKFFILSGALDADNLKRITGIGVASVILKPFDPGNVLNKIKEKCIAAATTAPAKTTVSYDAAIIRAVTAAMQEIIKFYLGDGLEIGKPYVKSGSAAKGYFSAVIPLNQGQAMGSVGFSCNTNFLKRLAVSIFGDSEPTLTPDLIRDLAGEMCNQISGKIKINFTKIDYYVNIGLPQVVVGENHSVTHPGKSPIIVIPMTSNECKFVLEFTMNGSLVKGKPEGMKDEPEGEQQDLTSGALFF
ncbi:MAG: response regulator [Proteobacteria bacterium]|nr:MAG: response regulator [Pseudomonadota bacterium]